MAEYREVSDVTQKLFNQALDATSIPHWVEFRLVADDNLKINPVKLEKQNKKVEYVADGLQAILFVNEEIFDGLVEDEIKLKVLEEELTKLKVDLEKGTIIVEQHDFSTNSDFLEKYGADEVLLIKMSIRSLYDQKKQKEEEEKERIKENKKSKKGKKS